MKKIVFLDIDGTLVTPNYPLSDFVKKGIKKARENGHLIFLCTGRNRVGIESIMSDDFDGCICSAGGYLEIKGEMIETTYLDKEEVEQARKVFEQNHILYNLESTYMTFASEELRHYFAHALLGDEGTNSEFERLKEQQKKEYHMVDIKIKEFINFVLLLLIEKILKKQKYFYQIIILLFMKCLANILSMVKSSKKEWIRDLLLKRSLKHFI